MHKPPLISDATAADIDDVVALALHAYPYNRDRPISELRAFFASRAVAQEQDGHHGSFMRVARDARDDSFVGYSIVDPFEDGRADGEQHSSSTTAIVTELAIAKATPESWGIALIRDSYKQSILARYTQVHTYIGSDERHLYELAGWSVAEPGVAWTWAELVADPDSPESEDFDDTAIPAVFVDVPAAAPHDSIARIAHPARGPLGAAVPKSSSQGAWKQAAVVALAQAYDEAARLDVEISDDLQRFVRASPIERGY